MYDTIVLPTRPLRPTALLLLLRPHDEQLELKHPCTGQSPFRGPKMRLVALMVVAASAGRTARVSNVVPRVDTVGDIVNAHAGGIYNFSGTF